MPVSGGDEERRPCGRPRPHAWTETWPRCPACRSCDGRPRTPWTTGSATARKRFPELRCSARGTSCRSIVLHDGCAGDSSWILRTCGTTGLGAISVCDDRGNAGFLGRECGCNLRYGHGSAWGASPGIMPLPCLRVPVAARSADPRMMVLGQRVGYSPPCRRREPSMIGCQP
jgi:hypothetical protein